MSDAKTPPDLSMDEILATIRRIIAEDEHAGSSPATASAGGDSEPEAPGRAQPAGSDDVLELTEALNDDGTTRQLAPIGGAASREPAAPPEPELAAAPSEREPLFDAARLDSPRLDANRREPSGPTLEEAPGGGDAGLVSAATSRAVSESFGRAAAAPQLRREPAMVGDRRLEEMVRELLRPLLQTWLDDNLPRIVERAVQAELDRIAGTGKPD